MLNVFLIICSIASIPFAVMCLLYTFLIAGLPRSSRQPGDRPNEVCSIILDPIYVFMLPCLNEGKVIRNTIEGILCLPYDDFLILVIDDDSDDDTVDIVRSIQDPRVRLVQRKRPYARQGKGEALNYGYQQVSRAVSLLGVSPDRVIIGVIDGDGRPTLDMLANASTAFKQPTIGAAQARVRIANRERLLPLMEDLEFASAVGAMQNSREYFGSVGLGGNGQFTRLTALRSLGQRPWTRCLLEDFDLGLRLLLEGWETRFLYEASVFQQGLTSPRRFIRQRARWAQGNMQCLRYCKDIWRSHLPWRAKMDLFYFLAQPWMNLMGTVLFIAWFITLTMALTSSGGLTSFDVSDDLIAWTIGIAAWLFLTFLPGLLWGTLYYHSAYEERLRKCVLAGLVVPFYNLFVLPSAWLALWRHITGKNSWAKTERISEQSLIPGSTVSSPT